MVAGGIIAFIDSKRKKPFGKYDSPGRGWEAENDRTMKRIGISIWSGIIMFLLWAAVLIIVILLVNVAKIKNAYLTIFEVTYRLGSLIFGGGQVLLPLLQSEVVPEWMTKDRFYQGLALAQSMPGPLFNFAAFLGAAYKGVPGAFLGYLGIFSPGVILIFAAVPFWAKLRHAHWFRVILHGLNSTAIGLIGAACIILFTAVISTTADAIVFYFALILSATYNLGAPYVIIAGGILGAILSKQAASIGQVKFCSL
jgi:chromate transporter